MCKAGTRICVHWSSADCSGPLFEDTTPDLNTPVTVIGTEEYDNHVADPTEVMCMTCVMSLRRYALGGALNASPLPCGNNLACEVTYSAPSHYVTCVGTDTGTANVGVSLTHDDSDLESCECAEDAASNCWLDVIEWSSVAVDCPCVGKEKLEVEV